MGLRRSPGLRLRRENLWKLIHRGEKMVGGGGGDFWDVEPHQNSRVTRSEQ